jgi:hypothetical protein
MQYGVKASSKLLVQQRQRRQRQRRQRQRRQRQRRQRQKSFVSVTVTDRCRETDHAF